MPETPQKGTILGLLPGDIIEGRFQIGELIGYGGQGAVLSVNHIEWDRKLALKLPLPDAIDSPKKLERFVREAEAWIRLGVHPNIVRCWFVRKVNGMPGLFLDLISGGSLDDKLKSGEIGPGKWNRILDVMVDVAEGLAHSHNLEMIHRDIKPENILLHPNGEACVTDFGLVKSADRVALSQGKVDFFQQTVPAEAPPKKSDSGGATGVGEFLGTPRYGAPEQWNKDMKVTPATDIYSLGVVFFEMLTGRRPFDAPGENPDPLALIQRHLQDPVPKPSEFQEGVPADIEALCLKCLAKTPELRPQNGIDLVDALVVVKEKMSGVKHARPIPLPEKERPSLMNNAGVSLLSLGRVKKGRENIEKGLLLQADHPECLYNLVQLERRAGRMGEVESLQRLRRANAALPLALLCIEEGHAKLAYQIVKAVPDEKKTPLLHRTQGDALMYMGEFSEAAESYRTVRKLLPADRATYRRLQLAEAGKRSHEGHTYFPLSTNLYSGDHRVPEAKLLLTSDGKLLEIASEKVSLLDASGEAGPVVSPRPSEATAPLKTWLNATDLVIQDETGFELWSKTELKPLGRSPGEILTVSESLSHIVFFNGEHLMLLDNVSKSSTQVTLQGTAKGAKACFDTGQTALYVLTPEGVLGQLNSQCQVEPLSWPPRMPDPSKVRVFQVHQNGVVGLGTDSPQLLLLNLKARTLVRRDLPFQPTSLVFDPSGETLVVSDGRFYGVFQTNGRLLHTGKGACAVAAGGRYLLAWASTLNVYSLAPFHKVRSFSQQTPPPNQAGWSADGRWAVTVTGDKYQVWEVDEDYRVYERELLLTPGETYEDLIQSYIHYNSAIRDALRLKDERNYAQSYRALSQARFAKGFLQSEQALTLLWELSTVLERESLEALWERMFYRGISAVSFSRNGRLLAIARGNRCEIRAFTGISAPIKSSIDLASVPENLHFHNSNLLAVETRGNVHIIYSDGSYKSSVDAGLGVIVGSAYRVGTLLLWNKSGQLRGYDPAKGGLTPIIDGVNTVRGIQPLSSGRALCTEGSKVKILNLRSGSEDASFLLPEGLTRVACLEDEQILLAGFEDGRLRAIDMKNGKEVFSTQWDVGPISGIRVNRALAYGMVVSSTGRLLVFDLRTGKEFISFTAHGAGISQMEMTDDGRFLLTLSKNGQFRLWETCWRLTDTEGFLKVPWMPTESALGRFGKFLGRQS